jgi:hypothetical protein
MEPNILNRNHKRLLPVPILSQLNPIYPPYPTSWRSILVLHTHLRMGLPSSLFRSGCATSTPYTLSTIRATCPAHLILLDFITRTILGEKYRSFNGNTRVILNSLPVRYVCPNMYYCVLMLPLLWANLFSSLLLTIRSIVQQNIHRTPSNNCFPTTDKKLPNHIFRCPLRANLPVLPTATRTH